jgi:Undecaprenyl-phosphate galactose phosphotransferase WbaP
LYPGIALSPTAELRSLTSATTLVYLGLGALTFAFRAPFTYSRGAFLGSWAVSLFAIPLVRACVRGWLRDRCWWGYRAIVLGGSGAAGAVVKSLVDHPEIGLRPVAIFDDHLQPGSYLYGVQVIGGTKEAAAFAEREGLRRAIVALPDEAPDKVLRLLDEYGKTFSRIFVVPGLHGLSAVGVEIRDMSRTMALELRKSLLMAGPRATKRCLDLALTTAALVFLGPAMFAIAALIKLESRGGAALYSQGRVGLGRGAFRVWKFRTMVPHADQALAAYLEAHPELRAEWERDHKLKKDPRVTRIGRLLRKTSLDELPQLINVLRGEMSLVGPRPIVDGEIAKYGESFGLYTQVIPGLTGLWQVSGRNLTTYDERVELDNYYVRNWSPWLDIWVLARTVKVVVTGYGAY